MVMWSKPEALMIWTRTEWLHSRISSCPMRQCIENIRSRHPVHTTPKVWSVLFYFRTFHLVYKTDQPTAMLSDNDLNKSFSTCHLWSIKNPSWIFMPKSLSGGISLDGLWISLSKWHGWSWFYGVAVSTLDFESSDPSSNLGRTCLSFFFSFVYRIERASGLVIDRWRSAAEHYWSRLESDLSCCQRIFIVYLFVRDSIL